MPYLSEEKMQQITNSDSSDDEVKAGFCDLGFMRGLRALKELTEITDAFGRITGDGRKEDCDEQKIDAS